MLLLFFFVCVCVAVGACMSENWYSRHMAISLSNMMRINQSCHVGGTREAKVFGQPISSVKEKSDFSTTCPAFDKH